MCHRIHDKIASIRVISGFKVIQLGTNFERSLLFDYAWFKDRSVESFWYLENFRKSKASVSESTPHMRLKTNMRES